MNQLIPSYLRGEWERMERRSKRLRFPLVMMSILYLLVLAALIDVVADRKAVRTLAAKQAVEIKLQAERIAQLECDTKEQRKLLNMTYPGGKFNWECGR